MKPTFSRQKFWIIAALALSSSSAALSQSSSTLERGFATPPETARPRVWWHWMNGNITKDGIALDLEWMSRIGLGGFQNFDAAFDTPQVVNKRLIYMTPEWKDAFLFATKKAQSLEFEEAVAGSPGWSESGGPWVPASQAMKKLVWSETHVEGGKPFHKTLPPVPSETGPFGNFAQQDPAAMMGGISAPKAIDFSADTAVIAYREPADHLSMQELDPVVTGSDGSKLDGRLLWDGDLNHTVRFAAEAPGKASYVQLDFRKPRTMRSATLVLGASTNFGSESGQGLAVESSTDGHNFTTVVRMPTFGFIEHTITFAPVTARYFRLSFHEREAPKLPSGTDPNALGIGQTPQPTMHEIAEFVLHPEARVNRYEEKAAFAAVPDLYVFATGDVDAGSAIAKDDVIDLTAKMKQDGTLDWTPPSGRWTVLRMGYSLTGITNHPAPPEATGPEVDKLNAKYVKAYINHYLDNYKDASGNRLGKGGLAYLITDSWEAGTDNWTDDMITEFTKRRGYDPHPWMPVLTGRIVASAQESDRFLWDLRRTIAELLAENHYGTIAAELHARGMGQYGESHEAGRATIGDGMEMKRADDVPMAAMWTQQPGVNAEQYGYNADIRESASVAHIYGQNLVAAESLTAASNPWAWSPQTLKPTADKELAVGLNRFVIHSSVHQPLIGKAPGLTLGPFGQWFNRNEIWAEQAKPWITYLGRSSWLLQQGRFVADIAYFYGEDSNLTAIFAKTSPAVPGGFNYDFVNGDILMHKLAVKNGRITTESGMSYRVLVLDPYSLHMSLPVLKSIQTLVQQGATVIGEKPTDTPSLADDKQAFQALADALWSGKDGKGHVIGGPVTTESVASALKQGNMDADISYEGHEADSHVLFVHRKTDDADLYYVDNQTGHGESIQPSFRVTGNAAELWHADTGKIEDASYISASGRTTVPLKLDPYETVFVVFRKVATASSRVVPDKQVTALGVVEGPWKVRFEPNRGAPAQADFPALKSFSENADPGIKYFSGHATYTRTLNAPASWFHPGAEMWLDLGDVANLAEVKINGNPVGTAWKAPYRLDVSGALKPGSNAVEITVADLWVNRLIGDQQPGVTTTYTFTTRQPIPYKVDAPLVPAGLLGPVQVIRKE
jgi:hypothetical protein